MGGQFKNATVNRDEYFIACSRYIELNPVRAAIVSQPKYYQWSSCWRRALPGMKFDDEDVEMRFEARPDFRGLVLSRFCDSALRNRERR